MMARKKGNLASTAWPSSDAEWEARQDMRTLADARTIEADARRLARAQKAAEAEIAKHQSILAKSPKPLPKQRPPLKRRLEGRKI